MMTDLIRVGMSALPAVASATSIILVVFRVFPQLGKHRIAHNRIFFENDEFRGSVDFGSRR